MALLGAGTKNSPIAIDDSEDEVIYELSKDSSSRSSPTGDKSDSYQKHATPDSTFDDLGRHSETAQPIPRERKRKRAGSFASQDIPVSGPSRSKQQRNHPSLVNRLSQPESKKARKRRRKAERQAQEEARLKNIHYSWLNKTGPFADSMPAVPPHASWSHEHQVYSDPSYVVRPPSLGLSMPMTDGIFPRSYLSYDSPNPYQESNFYDNYESHSVSPPPNSLPPTPTLPPSSTSDWVSAMAMAAEGSTNVKNVDNQMSHWSPMSTQISLPPVQPPPLPPPYTQNTGIAPKSTTGPLKPMEHHALPPKPPPPQPIASIGMQPDQDPNSKHGIFHIIAATKDVGTDAKRKRKDQYIPNPARTLVMEQLPKTHRHPEFINKWSRSACGAPPVHLFIDGPRGKALIEFATAELARKAWSSPKLGAAYANQKPHQLKGKPREDLIKVWWYRVDGVGAGAGVGEIEEGEIEGDAGEKEPEFTLPKKETKKERKARLAKEREEKRLVREAAELQAAQERQAQQPPPPPAPMIVEEPVPVSPQHILPPYVPTTSSSASRRPVTLNGHVPQFQTAPPLSTCYSGSIPPHFPAWIQSHDNPSSNPLVNKTAYGASIYLRPQGDDNESIASSAASSASGERANPMEVGQIDDLEDFEEADMDVDVEDVVVPPPRPQPPAPPLIHSSLPPRPMSPVRNTRPVVRKPPQPQFSASATPFVPKNPVQNPPPQRHPLFLPQPPTNVAKSQPTHAPVLQRPRPQNPTATPTVPPSASLPSVSTVPSPSVSAFSLTPVPSEPKAMKNAPTEPSFTKRALMARQRELEEKIAQSKLELAAATSASKPAATPANVQASQSAPVKTPMNHEEKQAMEDRLRKLVMQSQRAKAKPGPKIVAAPDPLAAVITPPTPSNPSARTHHEEKTTTTTTTSSTISVSTHNSHDFSLEDLAVSFITQTIETMKSKSGSVKTTSAPVSSTSAPAPAIKPAPSYSHVKSDLAAKQKRLEEHISESKNLMTRLSQCRAKEEKEEIMKIMREKTRIFEAEESKAASSSASTSTSSTPTSSSLTASKWNSASGSVVNKTQATTTSQQIHITRWPVSQQDSGVLMISDDEDEDENEEDDDDDS
ncbi:hypothetical protein CVT25_008590 [Psilocybe cyanescens]|uniref:Uncharacterized protein n=1 Tax=Psilocybe cyanescens TaxID=93625 RepID=A0A409XNC3_PSICY|nr:hypothetical protein CVT25_008590 [Psilocybe cyanescens]